MTDKFYFHDKIIFFLLAINALVISSIPGGFKLSSIIYFIHFGLFAMFFASILDIDDFLNYRLPKLNFTLLLLYSAFVLFMISSFLVNYDYNTDVQSISKLLTYPIIFFLFFVYLPKKFYHNDILFENFLDIILIVGTIISIVSLAMYFVGISLNPIYSFAAAGIFGHPNNIALMYTIVIQILIYKFFTKQFSVYKFVFLFLPLLTGLLFTYSRGGYIGSCVAILVQTYKKSKIVFIITVIILILAALSLFPVFSSTKGDSSYPRLLLALTALDMIFNRGTRYMFWGYGIFNNISVFTKDKLLFGSTENVVDPHNLFLLLSIQFGILLAISIILIFVYIVIRIFMLKKKADIGFVQKINLCLAISIGLFFHNQLEDIVVYPEYYVMPLFLIFLGYLYNSIYTKRVNK